MKAQGFKRNRQVAAVAGQNFTTSDQRANLPRHQPEDLLKRLLESRSSTVVQALVLHHGAGL